MGTIGSRPRILAVILALLTVGTVHARIASATTGAAPQGFPPEIVLLPDGTCAVYPVGDSNRTTIRPPFGVTPLPPTTPTLPEIKVTPDVAHVQLAIEYCAHVTLMTTNLAGVPTKFHFGNADFSSQQPGMGKGLASDMVLITKDVVIEGEEGSPYGRAMIVGGSAPFTIFPNQALYYHVSSRRFRLGPGVGIAQFYAPIPVADQAKLPAVTIRRLDSDQASLDFIMVKAGRRVIIDDVSVTGMASPWDIPSDPLKGKWLFPIEIVPGNVLVFGEQYVEHVEITNCRLSPGSSSIQEVGILVEVSAGTVVIAGNKIDVSYAGIGLLWSPSAAATIQGNEITVNGPQTTPTLLVPSSGIALVSANNAFVANNTISGTGSRGLAITGSARSGNSTGNVFQGIDMRLFTARDTYIWCDPGAISNSGSKIGVPPGTSCDKYILDQGTDNSFGRLEVTGLTPTPNSLWPPNRKMVPVSFDLTTSDGCGAVSCRIVNVTSSEPADPAGDWELAGPLLLRLRADRLGKGDGRVYAITVECRDEMGSTASKTVLVSVPHDQRR
jgi:hypothetical protein